MSIAAGQSGQTLSRGNTRSAAQAVLAETGAAGTANLHLPSNSVCVCMFAGLYVCMWVGHPQVPRPIWHLGLAQWRGSTVPVSLLAPSARSPDGCVSHTFVRKQEITNYFLKEQIKELVYTLIVCAWIKCPVNKLWHVSTPESTLKRHTVPVPCCVLHSIHF